MSRETVTTAKGEVTEYSPAISLDRRYIPGKEARAYIISSSLSTFEMGTWGTYFTHNVLNVDLMFMAKVTALAGIWDIINDTLIGTLVDRTRTRFGKFKPYIVGFLAPVLFANLAYWFMPLIFRGTAADDPKKLIYYAILYVARETLGTFMQMGGSGILATITPNPNERTSLITRANFLGSIYSNAPELLTGFMIDLIAKDVLDLPMDGTLVFIGVFCMLVQFGFQANANIRYHERVMQSIKKPSLIDGLRSVVTNRPLLMLTLSEFLSNFSVSGGKSLYYTDVLGSATLKTIIGIPGSPISYLSYTFVPWFRQRFSTKALWFIQHGVPQLLWVLVFVIGIGWYDNLYVMVPLLMLQECAFCFFYALKKIIPTEIFNEAMDYSEWKNGYRTEAMTTVARGLIGKISGTATTAVNAAVLSFIGYQQGGMVQSDKTKFGLFALFTIIPVVTGALGYIPMLFYNLTGEKRDKMYEDLMQRRSEAARKATETEIMKAKA